MNFKALMHFLSTNPNPTIRKLAENVEFGWNRDEDDETEKFSGYRVNQDDFKFDEKVFGKFWIEEKKHEDRENKKFQEFWNLEVYSYELKTLELIKWVENKTKDYRIILKVKPMINKLFWMSVMMKKKIILKLNMNYGLQMLLLIIDFLIIKR